MTVNEMKDLYCRKAVQVESEYAWDDWFRIAFPDPSVITWDDSTERTRRIIEKLMKNHFEDQFEMDSEYIVPEIEQIQCHVRNVFAGSDKEIWDLVVEIYCQLPPASDFHDIEEMSRMLMADNFAY